jgi:leucyl aminopeptidase
MTLELAVGPDPTIAGEVRIIPVFTELVAAKGTLAQSETLSWQGFKGALAETLRRIGSDGEAEILVGLGPQDKLDREALRRVGAALARASSHAAALVVSIEGLDVAGLGVRVVASALAEGAGLGAYRYERYKSDPSVAELVRIGIDGPDAEAIREGLADARLVVEGVSLARDLVNTPASDLTPIAFSEIAMDIARRERLDLEVLDEAAIEAGGLGGLLTVSKGSDQPPRLVRITYTPEGANDSTPVVCLVGKGITFDSGGLAIKPAAGMMTMKSDMSGAAAVLGTLSVVPRLAPSVKVIALMPLTENMSGGSAVKPGDVFRARNGKSIEVLNPDAEGRLVLADALSLAVEAHADAIVDLATLTGACVQALGNRIAGLMGNDDRAIDQVRVASKRAGEPMWPLPLPAGYHNHIDSEVADMKNIGNGQAGALSAGLLLEEFVADVPWVHLDIAGPARSTEDSGYLQKGGTGFGVRTLIELLRTYEPLGGATEGVPEGKVVFW